MASYTYSQTSLDSDINKAQSASSFEAVIYSARAHDKDAFRVLYENLENRIRRFAQSRGAGDPEGIVNEVFLKVFRSIDRFDGTESEFEAWVMKIAKHCLIDESRRNQRRIDEVSLKQERQAQVADNEACTTNVEAEVEERISTELLIKYLDVLTKAQRDVVMLRIMFDLTVDQVAKALGKRPAAIKALQRRAFRTIQKQFGQVSVPL